MPDASLRRTPPALLMGLTNLPFGLCSAVLLITVPQLLAAKGVSQPTIATLTATAMIPSFCSFLLAPILDVRFSRRSYAIGFGLLGAVLTVAALAWIDDLTVLGGLLVAANFSIFLNYNALGGWLGDIVATGDAGRLGAGFTIGNIAGFGFAAIVHITLIRLLPTPWGIGTVGLVIAAPLVMLAWLPLGTAERRGVHESFARLARDLRRLVQSPAVLRTLLLFCLPAASFALTNALGGLGGEYGASERLVSVLTAIGVTVAGVFGSLAVPQLVARTAPPLLYLAIGILGAVFTFVLLGLPRTPAVFALALLGQNLFQSAAFAVESTIVFRSIGEDNPLAATQFALLQAATMLPLSVMQALDGRGYAAKGLAGSLLTDAGVSLAACIVLLPLVLKWEGACRPVPGL